MAVMSYGCILKTQRSMHADSWERVLLKMDVRGLWSVKTVNGAPKIYMRKCSHAHVMASASHSVWEYLCSTADRARLANCTIRPFYDSTAEMPTGLASICISVCLFGSK